MTRIILIVLLLMIVIPSRANQAKDTDETERFLKERISTNRADYIALTELGNIYVDQGDRKKALRFFNDAIKIAPDYPPAHFSLGRLYFLMQRAEDTLAEFELFKEKMTLLPDMNAETKETYIKDLHYICEVYFALKEYKNFRSCIDEILKINPKDQTALYNLAVYYYVYEHSRAKAYELFKKVIELDPDKQVSKKAQYAIEYIRHNPDSRVIPDFSFVDKE